MFNDKYETYDMVYQWRTLLDEFQVQHGGPTRVMMTEGNCNTTFIMKYFQSDDGHRQGSHIPFNFGLILNLNEYSTAQDFKNVIEERLLPTPAGKRMNYVLGNHDRPRVGSRYGENRIDCLLTLLMTLPGIAVTYQGEEIGMLDNRNGIPFDLTVDPKARNLGPSGIWKEKSRDPQRTPFQWDNSMWAGFSHGGSPNATWLPIHPNYKYINLKAQKSAKRSTYKFYKELAALRKHPTFVNGNFSAKVVGENQNVLAYTRYTCVLRYDLDEYSK